MARSRFEEVFLPHLSAAYNFARWLTRNEYDAQDVVQESYLRALDSFKTFEHGRDARAWLLTIVRNTCYTWMRRNRAPQQAELAAEPAATTPDPEAALLELADAETVRRALAELPVEYREVMVLREMEGLSYKEIAPALGIPLGTVMSRLSRARKELYRRLQKERGEKSA
jgi:RNA polymerase sigma-70 factor (ECF subfamily)